MNDRFQSHVFVALLAAGMFAACSGQDSNEAGTTSAASDSEDPALGPASCTAPRARCERSRAACTDLRIDAHHCGRCDFACPVPERGEAFCVDGLCTGSCTGGRVQCGQRCLWPGEVPMPGEDPCAVDDRFAVFVAPPPLGAPTGDGTRAHPLSTIRAGIDKVKAMAGRVYVCAADPGYPEPLVVANGVAVFGNFDCAGGVWKTGPQRAKMFAPASPAATAIDIAAPTRIEGVEIIAPPGTDAQPTSVGLLARNAGGLTLLSVKIQAGAGSKGGDGTTPAALAPVSSGWGQNSAPAGQVPSCPPMVECFGPIPPPSAAGGVSDCREAGSASNPALPELSGGPGGVGGAGETQEPWASLQSGTVPTATDLKTARGGFLECNPSCHRVPATGGRDGAAGTSGESSARNVGTFSTGSAVGYVADNDGVAGANGQPGQGGGGGSGGTRQNPASSGYRAAASGSGGGAGGCAGRGGGPGRGGGASIGIIAFESPMHIVGGDIRGWNGGPGGLGARGAFGTAGGGAGTPRDDAQSGAAGGAGGEGGAGGHGAGGPSIALAYRGPRPDISLTPVMQAAAGGPSTSAVRPSAAGLSQTVYEIQ